MSQATKRKHVVREVLGNFVTPTESQQIVKITGSRGNNLHETVTAQGESFLVSMPTKYRKNIWIKRGDYVIVDPIEEGEKVKAEISFILSKDHILYLQQQQLWPEGFTEEPSGKDGTKEERTGQEEEASNSEDESDLFVNTNRCNYQYSESEDEDSQEEEEEDEEEEKTAAGS